MSENYLYRLYEVECSYGTQKNYLNVKTDHGIIYCGADEEQGEVLCPCLNANDHIVGENITHFGRCKSPYNKVFGERSRRIGQIGDIVDGLGKLVGLNEGYLCEPETEIAWKKVSDKNLIEGVPAITDVSELTCYYGGKITIANVGSTTHQSSSGATHSGGGRKF